MTLQLDHQQLLRTVAERIRPGAHWRPDVVHKAAETSLFAAYGDGQARAFVTRMSKQHPHFRGLFQALLAELKKHPGFWTGFYAVRHHHSPLPAHHPWSLDITRAFGASESPPASAAAPPPAAHDTPAPAAGAPTTAGRFGGGGRGFGRSAFGRRRGWDQQWHGRGGAHFDSPNMGDEFQPPPAEDMSGEDFAAGFRGGRGGFGRGGFGRSAFGRRRGWDQQWRGYGGSHFDSPNMGDEFQPPPAEDMGGDDFAAGAMAPPPRGAPAPRPGFSAAAPRPGMRPGVRPTFGAPSFGARPAVRPGLLVRPGAFPGARPGFPGAFRGQPLYRGPAPFGRIGGPFAPGRPAPPPPPGFGPRPSAPWADPWRGYGGQHFDSPDMGGDFQPPPPEDYGDQGGGDAQPGADGDGFFGGQDMQAPPPAPMPDDLDGGGRDQGDGAVPPDDGSQGAPAAGPDDGGQPTDDGAPATAGRRRASWHGHQPPWYAPRFEPFRHPHNVPAYPEFTHGGELPDPHFVPAPGQYRHGGDLPPPGAAGPEFAAGYRGGGRRFRRVHPRDHRFFDSGYLSGNPYTTIVPHGSEPVTGRMGGPHAPRGRRAGPEHWQGWGRFMGPEWVVDQRNELEAVPFDAAETFEPEAYDVD